MSRALTSVSMCWLLVFSVVAPAHAQPGELALHVAGRGPVVVFESGLGQTHTNWDRVAAPLARCLTAVTYDRRGIGDGQPQRDAHAPVLATDVDDLLAATRSAGSMYKPSPETIRRMVGLYVRDRRFVGHFRQ